MPLPTPLNLRDWRCAAKIVLLFRVAGNDLIEGPTLLFASELRQKIGNLDFAIGDLLFKSRYHSLSAR